MAIWDGASWQPLGSGLLDGGLGLAVLPTRGGHDLIAIGHFETDRGGPGQYVARWDGARWSPMGTQVNAAPTAVGVFDDGRGPAVYVAASFKEGIDPAIYQLRKWDGRTWTVVPGPWGGIHTMMSWDDGNGPALYVGGSFTSIGGVASPHIAKWDGKAWSGVGGGLSGGSTPIVRDLCSSIEGGQPVLYVTGRFKNAGPVVANSLARWDGRQWTALGLGISGSTSSEVRTCAFFDGGAGSELVVAGTFTLAGGFQCNRLARWNGTSWKTLGVHNWVNAAITEMRVMDDGTGPKLYAAGEFDKFGGSESSQTTGGLARWDGSRWEAIGTGLTGDPRDMMFYQAPGERVLNLYVCGNIAIPAGGGNKLVRWDGAQWQPMLPEGSQGNFWAFEVFDDGSGPALYVGGQFTSIAGIPVSNLAKFDGTTWSDVGGGATFTGPQGSVRILRAVDLDGDGPQTPLLLIGGRFDKAGLVDTDCLAAWDGRQFTGFGTQPLGGSGRYVDSISWFDNESGRHLVIGGTIHFQQNDLPVDFIATWNGSNWAPLGNPDDGIGDLEWLDDAHGSSLYAVGLFTTIGGVSAQSVARYDGSSWLPVGGGIEFGNSAYWVDTIASYDGEGDPAIYCGGDFDLADGFSSPFFAAWVSEPALPPAVDELPYRSTKQFTQPSLGPSR